jgi:hypothetical protein
MLNPILTIFSSKMTIQIDVIKEACPIKKSTAMSINPFFAPELTPTNNWLAATPGRNTIAPGLATS